MGARVAVGVVLLLAGAFKLRRPTWRDTATTFGAPAWTVPLVLWVELVLGALLAAQVGGRWPALPAAVLLALFWWTVRTRVRAGDATPCGCFGQATAQPVGPRTVRRNAALTALAALGFVAPDTGSLLEAATGALVGLAIVSDARRDR